MRRNTNAKRPLTSEERRNARGHLNCTSCIAIRDLASVQCDGHCWEQWRAHRNGSQSARIAGSALGSTAGRFARVTACGLPDFVDLAFEETPKAGGAAQHATERSVF